MEQRAPPPATKKRGGEGSKETEKPSFAFFDAVCWLAAKLSIVVIISSLLLSGIY